MTTRANDAVVTGLSVAAAPGVNSVAPVGRAASVDPADSVDRADRAAVGKGSGRDVVTTVAGDPALIAAGIRGRNRPGNPRCRCPR